jgi:hypothetical protein
MSGLKLQWDVKSNVKGFAKHLNAVQKKQLPFATARALTWTAKDAQKRLQESMPETFNVTRKWWMQQQPTGIKVKSAKKAELQADVFTLAYFAFLQEEGGVKIPFKSRGILVPTSKTPKYGRKAGGAARVLAGKKIIRRGGKANGDPVYTLASGKRGVLRRKGKKRTPTELVYTYVPRANIRARMDFKAKAHDAAVKNFDYFFAKSLTQALKTAR